MGSKIRAYAVVVVYRGITETVYTFAHTKVGEKEAGDLQHKLIEKYGEDNEDYSVEFAET